MPSLRPWRGEVVAAAQPLDASRTMRDVFNRQKRAAPAWQTSREYSRRDGESEYSQNGLGADASAAGTIGRARSSGKSGALRRAELNVADALRRIVMRIAGKTVATFATVRGRSARLDIPLRRSGSGFFVALDLCRQALNLDVRRPSGARHVDLCTSISPS